MIKGLIKKEWLKTKWPLLALYLIGLGATAYDLLSFERVIAIKGAAHLWEILLSKDVLILGVIKYQPLLTGVVIAMAQFVPEMSQKRLKLTLHLPMPECVVTNTMLLYGLLTTLLLFLLQHLMLYSYTTVYLAPQLVDHILVSITPWFLAGAAGYGLTALMVLEPTWRCRVLYLAMSYGVLQLFYHISTPRAYQGVIWPLLLLAIVLCFSPILSISRFKDGVQ